MLTTDKLKQGSISFVNSLAFWIPPKSYFLLGFDNLEPDYFLRLRYISDSDILWTYTLKLDCLDYLTSKIEEIIFAKLSAQVFVHDSYRILIIINDDNIPLYRAVTCNNKTLHQQLTPVIGGDNSILTRILYNTFSCHYILDYLNFSDNSFSSPFLITNEYTVTH